MARRILVVNADDFGLSEGINRGIVRTHEQGVVTSASLLVRQPAAAAAAGWARSQARLSVGLHLDLGEWAYRGGAWAPLYEVVALDDRAAVASEIEGQLARFQRLLGRPPTHLDSHQHVHLRPPVREAAAAAAARLGVPLRSLTPGLRYCGDFYGQTAEGRPRPGVLSPEGLVAILRALPAGLTELGCHPGLDTDLATMYRAERAEEVRVLCDPGVRAAIAELGIELRSFAEVGHELAVAR